MTEEKKKKGFKLSGGPSPSIKTPEDVFYSLQRPESMPHPWAKQSEVWKVYAEKYESTKDLAFELPTGSGKTLIALVLGEYRRIKHAERILYLCPTRQLAQQAGRLAAEYGIDATVCIRPVYKDLAKFNSARAIAISTYSALFNSNPKFDSPDVLLLDDAHSAEDYMARMWSLALDRDEEPDLFNSLIGLFREEIGDAAHFILDEQWKEADRLVYALAQPLFLQKKSAVIDLMTASCSRDKSWSYAWTAIKSSLHACQLFYSADEILIRPFIPPTETHAPFANAKQRIFMSATLGSGGELERMSGVANITRVPLSGRRENSGRRLFLFPDSQLEPRVVQDLLIKSIDAAGRGLVLAPTNKTTRKLKAILTKNGVTVLGSKDVEDSMNSFVASKKTALVLSNRYDGLDFAHESCRLLILAGRPAGTNLQEWFLLTRLNTSKLLLDRIRTRFVQGVGRCCRSETDYCAVIVLDQELYQYCCRTDFVKPMSPELQAEIQFGLENSEAEDVTVEDFLNLIQLLLDKTSEWKGADTDIRQRAQRLEQKPDTKAALLSQVAPKEVKFAYQLWKKEYSEAVNTAVAVADALTQCEDADAYRSWWLYLAGCVSVIASTEMKMPAQQEKAKQLFKTASSCSNNVSWFSEIVHLLSAEIQGERSTSADIDVQKQCELTFLTLSKLGFSGSKFDRRAMELKKNLGAKDFAAFENGLRELGEWLGFRALRPNQDGTPDGIWFIANDFVAAFECKSEAAPSKPISHEDTRQADAHSAWVNGELNVAETVVRTVMITPQVSIASNAHNVAANNGRLFCMACASLLPLADKVIQCVRNVRNTIKSQDSDNGPELIKTEFEKNQLLGKNIIELLTVKLLSDVPISK